jgi:hypothetical protein
VIQKRFRNWISLKQKGVSFNEKLMKNKAFHNPQIFKDLMKFVHVDEFGSNFEDKWDLPSWIYCSNLGKMLIFL